MCCLCVFNCVSLYFYHHTYVRYAIHVVLHVAYMCYTCLCYSHLSIFRVFYMTNLRLILTHVISLHMVFTYSYMFVIARVIPHYIHVLLLHVGLNTDILLVHYLSDRMTALHHTHDNDCVRVYAYPLLQAADKYMHFLLP